MLPTTSTLRQTAQPSRQTSDHNLVVSAPQSLEDCAKVTAGGDVAGQFPMVRTSKSRHDLTMIDVGQTFRGIALTVIAVLVAASTVIPSLSYAQKYADHLSQYGGYDARIGAITGFAALYVSPSAPMLPVVLEAASQTDMDVVLPSSCAMDKTVLPGLILSAAPCDPDITFEIGQTHPTGLDQTALRGPPRMAT